MTELYAVWDESKGSPSTEALFTGKSVGNSIRRREKRRRRRRREKASEGIDEAEMTGRDANCLPDRTTKPPCK